MHSRSNGPQLWISSRERVLGVCLRWISLGLAPIWAVLLAQAFVEHLPPVLVLSLMVVTLPLPVLYWQRERLGYVLTTKAVVLVLLMTVLYVESMRGFTPSAALLSTFVILLTTLLLGDRAFPGVLIACVANLCLGWALYASGLNFPDAWKLLDPNSAFVWIRHALVLIFMGGAVRDWSRNVHSLAEEELLNDLGGVLASSLDAEQTLREVSRRVVQQFADLCLIDLVRDGRVRRLDATANPGHLLLRRALGAPPLESELPCLGSAVLRTRKPSLVQLRPSTWQGPADPPASLARLGEAGARSLVCAPVIARGELLGVFTAVSSRRTYDKRDLQLWVAIAARAAMAVDNARLHADLGRAHAEIATQLAELQMAHQQIRTLTGLLPVCAWCGRIRDDRQGGRWRRFDEFVMDHTPAEVSHGICPDCAALHRGTVPGTSAGTLS